MMSAFQQLDTHERVDTIVAAIGDDDATMQEFIELLTDVVTYHSVDTRDAILHWLRQHGHRP